MNQSTDSEPLLLILMFYVICKTAKRIRTRMHSSRMHTARLLTISQHALPGGIPAQGVYLPGGCTCLGGVPVWEVYMPRGWCTCLGGCTCPRGVYLTKGGVPTQGGVPAQGGVPTWGGTCPGTPPVNRMTHRCKNITFANFVCGW